MLRIDSSKLRRAAEQLKQVTEEHAEWHENLLRSIFCDLPVERDDLAPFAHRLCCIGRWYYERAPSELREHTAFAGMGAEHERLHQVAGQMLRVAQANQPVVRTDFEELVATSARLRLEVDSLRLSIDAELVNRDPLTGAYGRIAMVPELSELARAIIGVSVTATDTRGAPPEVVEATKAAPCVAVLTRYPNTHKRPLCGEIVGDRQLLTHT